LLPADQLPPVVEQVELLQLPVGVEEQRNVPGWCPYCQRVQWAPLPAAVARGDLIGPRLTALIAYLKGACRASYSVIRKFLRDVLHVTISRGQLVKIIGKVSQALTEWRMSLSRLALGRGHRLTEESQGAEVASRSPEAGQVVRSPAVAAFERTLNEGPWAVYRVRRIVWAKGKSDRKTEKLAEGDRYPPARNTLKRLIIRQKSRVPDPR
jgi:hypothetical protein